MKVERINSTMTWHSKRTIPFIIDGFYLALVVSLATYQIIATFNSSIDLLSAEESFSAVFSSTINWGILRLINYAFQSRYLDEVWLDKPNKSLIVRNEGEEAIIPLRNIVSAEQLRANVSIATIKLDIISKFGETLHFVLPNAIRHPQCSEPHPDILLLRNLIAEIDKSPPETASYYNYYH